MSRHAEVGLKIWCGAFRLLCDDSEQEAEAEEDGSEEEAALVTHSFCGTEHYMAVRGALRAYALLRVRPNIARMTPLTMLWLSCCFVLCVPAGDVIAAGPRQGGGLVVPWHLDVRNASRPPPI